VRDDWRVGARGVPLQRRPVVGVEAGGPGLGAPAAAQEQALVTQDVLDRLLATCSPNRLADILRPCGCLSAQRPDIADLRLPRDPAWGRLRPVSQGRVLLVGALGEWLERGARFSGPRPQESGGGKESVGAAVDQPHSQAAVRAGWTGCDGVCRTWSEIGVRGCAPEHPVALDDATAAAAFGAAAAWLQ
jgi:hypothetical protein